MKRRDERGIFYSNAAQVATIAVSAIVCYLASLLHRSTLCCLASPLPSLTHVYAPHELTLPSHRYGTRSSTARTSVEDNDQKEEAEEEEEEEERMELA